MNDNTALVLLFVIGTIWNITLWAGIIYVILTFNVSWWLILIPFLFTVYPKGKSDES